MSTMTMTEKEIILKEKGYTHRYDLGFDVHVWKLNSKFISIHYNQAKATHDAYSHLTKGETK